MKVTTDCRICGVWRVRRTWTYGGVTCRTLTDTHDAYGYRAEFGDDHAHMWLPQRAYRDRGTIWGYDGIPCRHPGVLWPELVMVFASMEEIRSGFTSASVAERREIYHELLSLPSAGMVPARAEEIRARFR